MSNSGSYDFMPITKQFWITCEVWLSKISFILSILTFISIFNSCIVPWHILIIIWLNTLIVESSISANNSIHFPNKKTVITKASSIEYCLCTVYMLCLLSSWSIISSIIIEDLWINSIAIADL